MAAEAPAEAFESRTAVLLGLPPDADLKKLRSKIEEEMSSQKPGIDVECVLGPINTKQILIEGPARSCVLVTLSSKQGKEMVSFFPFTDILSSYRF